MSEVKLLLFSVCYGRLLGDPDIIDQDSTVVNTISDIGCKESQIDRFIGKGRNVDGLALPFRVPDFAVIARRRLTSVVTFVKVNIGLTDHSAEVINCHVKKQLFGFYVSRGGVKSVYLNTERILVL